MKVPWVVGRRKALARALAMELANGIGQDWMGYTQAQRDKLTNFADQIVRGWVSQGVLAEFNYDYREKE